MPQTRDTRETFIALRATRTAHRVASDVAYPELKVVTARPALPLEEEFIPLPPRELEIVQHEFSWKEFGAFLLLLALMVCVAILILSH